MNPRQRRGAVFLVLAAFGAIAVFFSVVGYVNNVESQVGDRATAFVEGSASVYAEGTVGPASGSVKGTVVAGLSTNKINGEQTISMTSSLEAAAEIGIPIPDQFIALSAAGKASQDVGVALTFDKDGNLVGMQVSMVGTVSGEVAAGLDTDAIEGGSGGKLSDLELPTQAAADGGRQFRLVAQTSFRNPDGSINHSAFDAAGSALKGLITQGRAPTEAERAAIRDQINNRSRITMDTYAYNEDENKVGGEIKWGPVGIGGEVHMATKDSQFLEGKYWNPELGQWETRVGCTA